MININKNKIVNVIKKYKVYIICIVIIILSIISVIIQYIDKNNEIILNSNSLKKENNKIAVYITGEIKNPGVYYLDENARLYQLLDVCGGITDDADITNVNLAKKLVDSDMITISQKSNDTDVDIETIMEEESSDKININTASKSELMTLNGIGEQTAGKIIEYRKNYKFNEIEDLMNVNGIGESKYNSIKEDICVD